MENWKFHIERLRPVAQVLADSGLRFGLEFVAPYHIRRLKKHEFIFTAGQMLELANDVGPNVGLLVGQFPPLFLRRRDGQHPPDSQRENRAGPSERCPKCATSAVAGRRRLLPGEGVIDSKTFLTTLRAIGYDGPVSVEVFSDELKKMPPAESAQGGHRHQQRVQIRRVLNEIMHYRLRPCTSVWVPQPEYNQSSMKSEGEALTDIIQLTDGFERAGEAYFSRDMQWIIFQAFPKGEDQYQMYVAPLMYDVVERSPKMGEARYATPMPNLTIPVANDIIRAGEPIRITPPKSRNTCGYFSPDGNSIIFGSTAGKDNPEEPSSGYQRQGGTYRWSFPPGMEIFRADGWHAAIEAAEPGKTVDLAKHAITSNDGYDAEGSYSPDGRYIIFTSSIGGDMEICAMRTDGTGFVQLTHEKGYDGGPFFSPDGKRIVYRSDRKGNDLLQVFVADIVYDHVGNISGIKNEKQLNHDGNVNWGPFWHPDGKHIIYATSRARSSQLRAVPDA